MSENSSLPTGSESNSPRFSFGQNKRLWIGLSAATVLIASAMTVGFMFFPRSDEPSQAVAEGSAEGPAEPLNTEPEIVAESLSGSGPKPIPVPSDDFQQFHESGGSAAPPARFELTSNQESISDTETMVPDPSNGGTASSAIAISDSEQGGTANDAPSTSGDFMLPPTSGDAQPSFAVSAPVPPETTDTAASPAVDPVVATPSDSFALPTVGQAGSSSPVDRAPTNDHESSSLSDSAPLPPSDPLNSPQSEPQFANQNDEPPPDPNATDQPDMPVADYAPGSSVSGFNSPEDAAAPGAPPSSPGTVPTMTSPPAAPSTDVPAQEEQGAQMGGLESTRQAIAENAPTHPTAPASPSASAGELSALPRSDSPLTANASSDLNLSGISNAPSSAAPPVGGQRLLAGGGQTAVQSGTADLTTDVPGSEELDGVQAPAVVIEKTAPEEIQIGKAAVFQTTVRNVGSVSAHGVVVTDRVPRGTRLIESAPAHQTAPDGSLRWNLGTLAPDEERLITIQVMPEEEGQIGSVAQVTFQARASVRTRCTRPQLSVVHTAPEKVLIGEDVVFQITISNPGTGAATGVVLEEDVPGGLVHPAGRELEYAVGTLEPGESRQLELMVSAEAPGQVVNVLRVRGDAGLIAEHRVELEVIAPQLQLAIDGPTRRYLERQGTYQIHVANAGTAAARHVDLVAYLPNGFQFTSATEQGQYDSQNHAVYWSLDELSAGQQTVLEIGVLPIKTGDQKLLVEARADLGLSEQTEHRTLVEATSELQFTVSDVQDPIEVGSETTYEIHIVNRGSKAARNVRLGAVLPDGLEALDGEGPSALVMDGQQVASDPLATLDAGAEAMYRIRARSVAEGAQIIRVQVVSDESPAAVTKEEVTRVYRDQ